MVEPKIRMLHSRWVRFGGCLAIVVIATGFYLSRLASSPDYDLHFERNVPSEEELAVLAPALEVIRTWPQWFHSLAGARFTDADVIDPTVKLPPSTDTGTEPPLADAAGLTAFSSALGRGIGKGATSPNGVATLSPTATHVQTTAAQASLKIPDDARVAAGRKILLFVDPQKGPWAKFEVLARVTQVLPGRLLVLEVEDDSTRKLTRQFDHLEWRVELRPGRTSAQPTIIHGEADAHTSHWRSRIFGQLARDVLMNQVYFMNLFKLASFGAPEDTDSPDYLRRK